MPVSTFPNSQTRNVGDQFDPLDASFFSQALQGQTGGLTRGEGPLSSTFARQRLLLGDLGALLPEGFILRRSDLAPFEANLNFQNRQQALRDRSEAIGRLDQERLGVGGSPEAILAREIAVQRARSGGAFGPETAERGRGALRSSLGAAAQSQGRTLSAELAQRGLGGALPAFQQAALAQALGVQSGQALADYDTQAAQLIDASQRGSLQDLAALASEDELRQQALSQVIAQLLIADRGTIDLSGLLGSPPGGAAPVGFFG